MRARLIPKLKPDNNEEDYVCRFSDLKRFWLFLRCLKELQRTHGNFLKYDFWTTPPFPLHPAPP